MMNMCWANVNILLSWKSITAWWENGNWKTAWKYINRKFYAILKIMTYICIYWFTHVFQHEQVIERRYSKIRNILCSLKFISLGVIACLRKINRLPLTIGTHIWVISTPSSFCVQHLQPKHFQVNLVDIYARYQRWKTSHLTVSE